MKNCVRSLFAGLAVLTVGASASAQNEPLPNVIRNSIERADDRKQRSARRDRRNQESLSHEEKVKRRNARKARRRNQPALPQLTVAETMKLIDSGDLDLGLRVARRGQKTEPKNALWKELTALFRFHRGRLGQQDLEDAQLAARMEPKNGHVLATCAIVFYFGQKYGAARSVASTALKLDKNNKRAQVMSAICPEISDQFVGTAFEKLPEPSPATTGDALIKLAERAGGETDVYYVLSRFFHEHTDRSNLVKVLDIWVKNKSRSAYAYYNRGNDKLEFGKKYKLAAQDYKKALQLNPSCALVLSKYALVLTRMKRYKEALDNYDLLAQVSRLTPAAHMHRADCLMELGHPEEAAIDYSSALNMLVPENQNISSQIADIKKLKAMKRSWYKHWLLKRAQAYSKGRETGPALADLKLALMVFPSDIMTLNERQKLYRKTKQNDLALKDLDSMIAMQKDVAPFYKDRAEVLNRLGRAKEAAADLKRAQNLEKTGQVDPPANEPDMDESE